MFMDNEKLILGAVIYYALVEKSSLGVEEVLSDHFLLEDKVNGEICYRGRRKVVQCREVNSMYPKVKQFN